jgi:hypothetical protein
MAKRKKEETESSEYDGSSDPVELSEVTDDEAAAESEAVDESEGDVVSPVSEEKEPVSFEKFRLAQNESTRVRNAKSLAGGLNDLEARDRLLMLLHPPEMEGSHTTLFFSRFRKLEGLARWQNAKKPPKSLLPETMESILALPPVRKVSCTSTVNNFTGDNRVASKHSLIFHDPSDSAAIARTTKTRLQGANVASTASIALGIFRYESGGPLTTAQWTAIGNRTATLIEHIVGDVFSPKNVPVKLRRLVTMVFAELHPNECPPDLFVQCPLVVIQGSLSYR